jgi:hypothetical protein
MMSVSEDNGVCGWEEVRRRVEGLGRMAKGGKGRRGRGGKGKGRREGRVRKER